MTIEVANSLIVGQTNTPLDARTRIATLADTATVANPYVGMRVYVLDEAKSYIVKSLKDKLIGAYTVPDAQIDTIEPLGADGTSSYTYIAYASDNAGTGFSLTPSAALPYRAEIVSATVIATPTLTDFAGATWVKYIGEDGADGADGLANPMTTAGDIIVGGTDGEPVRLPKGADGKVIGIEAGVIAWVTPTGGVGNLPMLFALPSKLEGDPALHFAIEFHETDDYSGTAVYSIDTAVSQTGVKVFDGTAWVPFPADGAGTIFYGNQIKIEYNEAMGGVPKNVRYKLYLKSDGPTVQPWKYTAYPAIGGADGSGQGDKGETGTITVIVSATEPENPGNGTIWIQE